MVFFGEKRASQEPADKTEKVRVGDFQLQLCHKPVVRHRVEKFLDVHFYDDAAFAAGVNCLVETTDCLVS